MRSLQHAKEPMMLMKLHLVIRSLIKCSGAESLMEAGLSGRRSRLKRTSDQDDGRSTHSAASSFSSEPRRRNRANTSVSDGLRMYAIELWAFFWDRFLLF